MNSEGILIFILILIRYSWASNKKDGLYCGRPIGTEFRIEERIVAGYDVGYYRYPWFAAIVSNGSVVCGGALIGPRTVLTAAHCYREYIKNPKSGSNLKDIYNVTLGIYNICEQETTRNVFLINKVNIHEQYEKMWPYCDLALLTLEGSTDNYETICLPRAPVSVRPKEGTVPGLGTLKYHGGTPCTLHEARILLYPDSDCKNMINRTGNDPSKLFKAFCAGYLQGGIDTCQGDSGGPLQVFDENGNYVLLGVVSYGFHCANPGLLGVYTDVSQHLDWIQEKTGPIGYDDSKNVNIAANQPHRKKTPVWAPIRIIIIQRKQMVVLKKKIKQTPIEILQNINK